MRKLKYSVFAFVAIVLLVRCAQVRSISGGEKDTQPPVLLTTVPLNGTLRFSGSDITLFFDEYIQLRDVQKEMLISPPLKTPPRVQVRQRSVVVSWNDTLRENTTYIFQFGKAISDLNESNVLTDASLVFSTGDDLDSLECKGLLKDAYTDKPSSSTKVLLFDSLAHVLSQGASPAYFTRTDDKGFFQFRYLRAGVYVLCALSDENNNNRYDVGEAIDWTESVVVREPADSVQYTLYLSAPRDTAVRSFDYMTEDCGVLKFKQEPWQKRVFVRSLSGDSVVQWMDGDTLCAAPFGWCKGEQVLEVSVEAQVLDTLELAVLQEDSARCSIRQTTPNKVRSTDSVEVACTRPIRAVNDTRLKCTCDSVPLAFHSSVKNAGTAQIVWEKKPGKTYRVTALPGWITDDCGRTHDTLQWTFTVYDSKELGSLRLKLASKWTEQAHTLRLLNRTKQEIWSLSAITSEEIVIDQLPPGDYTAVIGDDINRNGIFDPMQINPRKDTERNHVYPGAIQLRANWELVLDWPFAGE
jgi:hypothetical protein